LVIESADNDGCKIVATANEDQIMSVCDLFSVNEVNPEKLSELNDFLLTLSPIVPLSSLGKFGNRYVMFGAMAPDTTFANIKIELDQQFKNYDDVMVELSDYLSTEAQGE